MRSVESSLERLLPRVHKPARYLGNEWNRYLKDHSRVAVSFALAFPDLYEIGMSNQGIKIIYECVNRVPNLLVERVFAPDVDMEDLMRQHDLPLFSLESKTPLSRFDVVGFSLQYELSYTNVLNMLNLAGIPLYSHQRDLNDPLIIAGGPCAFNPEPLAPFFDLFLLGEAEESLPELLLRLAELKDSNCDRSEVLDTLASLEGVYIPSLYQPVYRNGVLSSLHKLQPFAPSSISKRVVKELDQSPYPVTPVVPYVKTVHDRAVIELFRGCARGCRFCQAGFIFRPVRRRSIPILIDMAEALISGTGYEELSLSSLSSSDYPQIEKLIDELNSALSGKRVNCSLPSLRLDSYSIDLADQLHKGRRSSLTFAPEAATDRLRRVINKNISEEVIFETLEAAVKAGWQGFKFYFMIGLPTEKESDVEAIVRLCQDIRNHFRAQLKRKLKLSVSVAAFVPKAHTPFQWEPQLSMSEIVKRQKILRDGFKKIPEIDFSWNDAETSMLEAVFARGDRTLAPVLERAWQLGCRFDGWSEHFSYELWQQAFMELNLDPDTYACRRFGYEDQLPWDHLDCGFDKKKLCEEHSSSRADAAGERSSM